MIRTPATLRRWALRLPIVLALLTAIAHGQGFLDEARKFFRVAVSPGSPTAAAGGTLDVVLAFDVDHGIHVYGDAERLNATWDETTGAEFVSLVVPPTKAIPDILNEGQTVDVLEEKFELRARFRVTATDGGSVRLRGAVHYQGCTDKSCYPPLDTPIDLTVPVKGTAAPAAKKAPEAAPPPSPAPAPAALSGEEKRIADRSFLLNILWAFVSGVLLSFTPCVYPIIPITISVLAQRRESGKGSVIPAAITYVVGLALTYAVVGLLVATVGYTVRAFLASPWFLIPLAGLFVLFALSMFDVIAIEVPQSWGEKLRKLFGVSGGTQGAGLFGVFAMGVIAGIVAGPCVAGPLAGLLGYVAKTGDKWLGFWMLFALGWGMGVVLIAAGTSTRLLPRAGGWMMRVKHFIGFVMLWAGAYFLIPIIGVTAYHLASAVLLIASPVFLGCFDALSAESGFGARLARVLGILALLYGSYLGFTTLAEVQGRPLGGSAAAQKLVSPFRHATPEDVDAALKGGRPVMVDLTCDDCAICKKLARDVFPTPQVVAAAQPFVALEVNLTRYPKFADRYPGHFPPTLLFFDAKGRRVLTPAIQSLPDRYTSLTADGFAAILKDVAAHLAQEGE